LGRIERLRMTPRAIAELGMVYRDPLEILREMIQNAADAGAKRVDIDVVEEGSDRWLVVRHDGAPIEGEYLEAFLTVGTDFKAKRGGCIGFFGIGRLAWINVGDIAIIRSGRRIITWRAEEIDRVVIEEVGEWFPGVEWRIRLRNDTKMSLDRIKRFVERNCALRTPEIYVGDKRCKTVLDLAGEKILSDSMNEVYLSTDMWSSCGLIVKSGFVIDRTWRLPKLIVVTRDERVRVSASRTVVLDSRFEGWLKEIARGVIEAVGRRGARWVRERFGDSWMDLLEAAFSRFREEEAREMMRWMVFEELTPSGSRYVFGKELKGSRLAYLTEEVSDSTLRDLWSRGFRVIKVSEAVARDVERLLGAKPATEVAAVLRGITEPVPKRVAEAVEMVAERVYEVLSEIGAKKLPARESVSEASIEKIGGELTVSLPSLEPNKRSYLRMEIVGSVPGGRVVFVRLERGDVVAFYSGGRIYINVACPRVAKLVEMTRRLRNQHKILLLWAPIIVHEMLHGYGLDHTDSSWHAVYEEALARIIVECVTALSRRRS